jgi:hypothetical protein
MPAGKPDLQANQTAPILCTAPHPRTPAAHSKPGQGHQTMGLTHDFDELYLTSLPVDIDDG